MKPIFPIMRPTKLVIPMPDGAALPAEPPADPHAPPHIRAGQPGGKISLGNYAEDLRNAFANDATADPWRAVARRALVLAHRVIAEAVPVPDIVPNTAPQDGGAETR